MNKNWVLTGLSSTALLQYISPLDQDFSVTSSTVPVVRVGSFAPDQSQFGNMTVTSGNLTPGVNIGNVLPSVNNLSVEFGFSNASSGVSATYMGIISRQCNRAQVFISNQLSKLEWEDEEKNEQVVNTIAEAIDLVGEPGIAAACQQLTVHRKHHFTSQKLLQAISVAKDQTTERHRVNVLAVFSREPDQVVRYNAVEALGSMVTHSEIAKMALRNIATNETNSEIANMAVVYSR